MKIEYTTYIKKWKRGGEYAYLVVIPKFLVDHYGINKIVEKTPRKPVKVIIYIEEENNNEHPTG